MRKLRYNAAASFSGKHHKFDPTTNTNVFHFNPYNHVQPKRHRAKWKRPDSGQDAFFISRIGDSNAIALGIADGVGGWTESGVDPADFAHHFCDYMAEAAWQYRAADHRGDAPLTPRALMQQGYENVCRDPRVSAGGSTACVAVASEDGTLEVANLGDSGFMHLRLNTVHSSSEPQTHAFNTPYQLSVVPVSVLARAAAFGGAQLCDQPKDADVTQHDLRHGDILIFASDGVWDNLFNQDILRLSSRLMMDAGAWLPSDDSSGGGGVRVVDDLTHLTQIVENGQRLMTLQGELALDIAGAAKRAGNSKYKDGPFAKEVHKYYPNERWHGGKVDDICVIVVVVSDNAKKAAPTSKL